MLSFTDTAPPVHVAEAEYVRLLGYPRGRTLEGRALELGEMARDWFAEHGRPWIHAREVTRLDVSRGTVCIGGVPFTSARLERTLRDAGADRAVIVAVSAGPEAEAEAQRRWQDEKPDEYFFLEVYGSAVVEQLVTAAGARLCAAAEPNGLAVLPHYSPGYPEWDIGEQVRLRELLGDVPGPLDVLESGMPRPKKSLLAVFGVTPHVERVRRVTDLVPCQGCSLVGCQYRRAPYGDRRRRSVVEEEIEVPNEVTPEPLTLGAKYATSVKALRRWAGDRLTLTENPDGTVDALFRYEGTTCSNAGRALFFRYAVTLGPRAERYPIVRQAVTPAEGDDGYTQMCRYKTAAPRLMAAIAEEAPLAGRPLDDVLTWQRPTTGAGCYCESESREHKWGLVLETIHYALAERLKREATPPTPQPAEAR
jgi:hypothetical protein